MALKIREFIRGLSVKQLVFSLIAVLSLSLYLILTAWMNRQLENLTDQQAARRWDEKGKSAQVSCFLAEGVEMNEFKIRSFEEQLKKKLSEVLTESGEETGKDKRLFIDAYSSLGRVTVVSEKGKLEADAVGIGGDFFLFHPLQLLYGGYFSGNDLMKDFVVLDEEAAWQLFGSNDVAGMSVTIGGVPHYVSGVIKRQEGRFAESAGLDKTVVYVSNETLADYGESSGICVYEVTAPDPVKGFVAGCVREHLGVEEGDRVVVENSSRYSPRALLPVILGLGTRSMQNRAVRFPYWENIGRGWEDVRAVVFVFQCLLLALPGGIILVFLIIKWRNRKFTWKDAGSFLLEAKGRMLKKVRERADAE